MLTVQYIIFVLVVNGADGLHVGKVFVGLLVAFPAEVKAASLHLCGGEQVFEGMVCP